MNNDMTSLSELFDKKIFRIPDYQRGYAWGTEQLEDFWDDINNLSDGRNHYTGMLSLKELSPSDYEKWEEEKWIMRDKGYRAFHVVDGQQRLTTFTILLSCILRLARANKIEYLNGDELKSLEERYIVEFKKPLNTLKAYKFGYEVDNPSFKYLRYTILEEGSGEEVEETFYTINLKNAKDYFDKKLKEFFADKGINGLEDLFRKLVNNLQFNTLFINNDFDVFVAFETMNNRGKKLSNLEILKNRLIYLTTIYKDSDLDQESKDSLRKEINDAWKEIYHQLGKNKDHPLDDDEYLKNHWSMYFKYSRNKGDDYIKYLLGQYFTPKAVFGLSRLVLDVNCEVDENGEVIQEYVDPKTTDELLAPEEILEYIRSLKSVASYWFYIHYPNNCPFMDKEEKEYVSKLNRIGMGHYKTLVCASFINKNVTKEQRIRLLQAIEKTIFVYFRMAKWSSTYQSAVAYNNARDLYKGEIDIETIIQTFEDTFANNADENANLFAAQMSTLFKGKDGFYSWSGLHYFLFEYELSLYKDTSVANLNDWDAFTKGEKDKISIEHIYPQTPKNYYWKNKFRGYSSDELKCLNGSLGNMLALSQSVNSSLQNDSFDEKKNGNENRTRGYCNGSHSEVEVAQYDEWTPSHILTRGLHLLSFLEKRWCIKFTDEQKMKILGLEFMENDRDIGNEIPVPPVYVRMQDSPDYDKLTNQLDGKSELILELYEKLYQEMKKLIPDIVEHANKPYIAFKRPEGVSINNIYVQNDRLKIYLLHEPLEEELKIGQIDEKVNWSHNYYVELNSLDQIELIVKVIYDSYKQMDE